MRWILGLLLLAQAQALTPEERRVAEDLSFTCESKVIHTRVIWFSDIHKRRMPEGMHIGSPYAWSVPGECATKRSQLIASWERYDFDHRMDLMKQECSAWKGWAMKPGETCGVDHDTCVEGHWAQNPGAMKEWYDDLDETRKDREGQMRAACKQEFESAKNPHAAPTATSRPAPDCGGIGPCPDSEECVGGFCKRK